MNAFDERLSESVQVNQFVSVTATSELDPKILHAIKQHSSHAGNIVFHLTLFLHNVVDG